MYPCDVRSVMFNISRCLIRFGNNSNVVVIIPKFNFEFNDSKGYLFYSPIKYRIMNRFGSFTTINCSIRRTFFSNKNLFSRKKFIVRFQKEQCVRLLNTIFLTKSFILIRNILQMKW